MLCLDHDAAGIEVTGRIEEILCEKNYCDPAYMDITVLHSEFKDLNEDLKALHCIFPFRRRNIRSCGFCHRCVQEYLDFVNRNADRSRINHVQCYRLDKSVWQPYTISEVGIKLQSYNGI